jgi:hypothetical protein
MAISVVTQPDGLPIILNGPEGTVIVEGNTPGEVSSSAARTQALNTGRAYLGKAGISNQGGPYPVGPDGEQLEALQGLPAGSRFRQDFIIREGL